ncbi:MAG: site-2 protease family protein [Candidatus Nezhaarchaeales archaeon]|nr:MAG: hypothetical protein DSO06_05260 [Candidatus Nezhaarchaeota archaeon WYZ-LMO8]TDA36016.1 MAG: hypothetical protein DSO05_04395 [Candidatus Nezhaarchaeota archaeon WYZ-LMO7]
MESFIIEVNEIVRRHFTISEWKVQYGVLTYIVKDEDTKDRFLKLYSELYEKGYVPTLKSEDGKKILRILKRREIPKHNLLWNLVLLIATIATVTFAGYLFTTSSVYEIVDPVFSKYRVLHLLAYVLSIFFVLGIHELGHKIACVRHNLKSTPPYFIPGPPTIGGSFGALMIQQTPILNRDQLFDLGLFGPLSGFAASIIITLSGLSLSYIIPEELANILKEQGAVAELPLEPLLFTLIRMGLLSSLQVQPNYVVLIHPIAFAGWVGMLVTFLNTLPVGQLDGGHVARAFFGRKGHATASLLAIAIMIVTGFVAMAILALLIFLRGHPGPLDDVSSLSRTRKILFLTLPLMCGLCFTSISFVVF